MKFGGFEVNPKHSERWYPAVGKFIVNFGAIEFLSIVWVHALSNDAILVEIAQGLELPKRVELIHKLIERRKVSQKLAKKLRRTLDEVLQMSETRNTVAHSPGVFGWSGGDESRGPDILGALRIKKLASGKPLKIPQISLQDLNGAIDATVKLGLRLHELLDAYAVELGLVYTSNDGKTGEANQA